MAAGHPRRVMAPGGRAWCRGPMFYGIIFGLLAILLVVAGVMTIRKNKRTQL